MADFEFDTRQVERGMKLVSDAWRDRTAPEIVNDTGKDIVLTAVQKTPAADKAMLTTRFTIGYAMRAAYVRLGKKFPGRKFKKAEVEVYARKLMKAIPRSANYIRGAGWSKAAAKFGYKLGSGKTGGALNPKSEAAKGDATLATPAALFAELTNNAVGADVVGARPLQEAMDAVGARNIAAATKKIQKNFDKALSGLVG